MNACHADNSTFVRKASRVFTFCLERKRIPEPWDEKTSRTRARWAAFLPKNTCRRGRKRSGHIPKEEKDDLNSRRLFPSTNNSNDDVCKICSRSMMRSQRKRKKRVSLWSTGSRDEMKYLERWKNLMNVSHRVSSPHPPADKSVFVKFVWSVKLGFQRI